MARSFDRRQVLRELEKRGVRITAQRRLLVEIIQSADGHMDAAALLSKARASDPTVHQATVYRMIGLLKKLRLLDELDLMHLEGEKHYYEVRTRRDHMHLACFQCGRIIEYASAAFERLKAELERKTGFEIKVARLEVGGTCKRCAPKGEKSGGDDVK